MKNFNILIFTAILSLFSVKAISQEKEDKNLELSSLSGGSVRVNVELDDVNDKITLRLNSNEMLYLNGYRELEENIRILNDKFIVIHYKIRSGSGVKMRKTSLLCVADGKLYKALDLITAIGYNIDDIKGDLNGSTNQYDESGQYTLKLIGLQNTRKGFILTAVEHEKEISKVDKQDNFEREDSVAFFFDNVNKVFYSKMITLNGRYMIEGESGTLRSFKAQSVPFIGLKDEECIYIDKEWYTIEPGNRLTKISY